MHAYQSVTTKYLPATDSRGTRVKATAQGGSVTVPWDYALNDSQNHYAVACALVDSNGWHNGSRRPHAWGILPDGKGYVMAFITY